MRLSSIKLYYIINGWKLKPSAVYFYTSSNKSLPTEQSGQTQSAGKSANDVPAGIPLSGSPTAGSYS